LPSRHRAPPPWLQRRCWVNYARSGKALSGSFTFRSSADAAPSFAWSGTEHRGPCKPVVALLGLTGLTAA
jgi:hypothetical protein